MDIDIIIRLLGTVGIISFGLFLYWLVNRFILNRNSRNRLDIEGVQTGKPLILYFTTPNCAPCRTVQRPAIQHVKEQLGEFLQVVEIDASRKPDIANRWGVLSVPTTFIIDRNGQARHVNHGITTAEKLIEQVGKL